MSETQEQSRQDRLEEGVAGIKARGGVGIPIERWLMIAGGGFVVGGLIFIVLGWFGASRTPYVFEQVPYMISGGLFGLALAVIGGLSYFAYWMTRQVQATNAQADETRAALARIEDLMAAGAGAGRNGARAIGIAEPEARGDGKTYVTTAKGTMFHRPDCVVVAGKSGLKSVGDSEKGLTPCKICDPLAAPSGQRGSAS